MSTHIPSSLMSPSRMKLDVVEMAERDATTSFRDIVLKKIGSLEGVTVLGENVLVASYIKPRKTAGGIIIPETSVHEDRYQCKVGLVIKVGEAAFKYAGAFKYEGTVPTVGDYVGFHTSDTREIGIKGVSCRTIDCNLIRMIVPDPDSLY